MSVQIVIPDERHAQLQAFAEARAITLADAIGELLNLAIERGLIPDEVPGFKIEAQGDLVSIEAQGAFIKALNRDAARQMAQDARALLDGGIAAFVTLPAELRLTRRGSGIKLRDTATGAERTMAPSVARDVVRLIEKASAE